MNTPQEFREQWGDDVECLVRVPREVLNSIRIPEQNKEFLAEFGLPDNLFYSTLRTNLPPLPNSLRGTEGLPADYERYRVMGDAGFQAYMCLDEEMSGRVVLVIVRESKEPEVMFVNSSYPQLVACWTARGNHYNLIDHASEKEKEFQIQSLEDEIHRIDPAALQEGSDWNMMFVRLRQGDPDW